MKKIFTLIAALTLSVGLWADGSVFTYTATEKLESQFADLGTVASHDFNNGAGTVTYNGTVTEIGDYAFEECSSLQSITIPAGVTTIGKEAFYLCFGLQSINFPDNLTTLGNNAFSECESLQSITIPASVTTIESYAFSHCGLTSVTFLGNACQNNIGSMAFNSVGETTPVTLVLPDNWTGSTPVDSNTPWYGGRFDYDAPAPAPLDSLVIKGKATKMEYEVGEAFDPAGLEVWGIYTKTVKHDSISQIKSGITWTLDPETFEEASDNASVTMVASYKDLTTADTTITGILVKDDDTEAPENFSAEVIKENTTSNSVELKLYAEDNSGEVIYTIKESGQIVQTANGVSGVEKTVTITDLEAEKDYTFVVTAKDEAGNEGNPITLEVTTPAAPAPAPYLMVGKKLTVNEKKESELVYFQYFTYKNDERINGIAGTNPTISFDLYDTEGYAEINYTNKDDVKRNFIVNPKIENAVDSIYQGETYLFADTLLTTAGTYHRTIESNTMTLTLKVKQKPFKYTTYENWQIKLTESEWENMAKVGEGLFKLEVNRWTGSGFNVKSDDNPIKKDWYDVDDPDVVIGEGLVPPLDNVDIYLRVIDDETLKIGFGEVPPVPASGPTVDETGITVNGRKYGFPVRLVKEVK